MQYPLIFIFCILSFFAPAPVLAEILDVQTDGSGNYLTINQAIKAAGDGDVILIGPGTFYEPIDIRRDNITLVGSGAGATRIEITNNFCLSIENSSNVLVEDIFFFTNSDMGDSTIYIDNSSVKFSYCVVKSSPDAYGIYCISGSSVDILHNTILDHKKEGGIRFDSSCEMVIKSNILMGNSFGINNISPNFSAPDISHNLLWRNGVDYNNSKKGTGDVSADPKFINLAKGDYRLKPSSPCIGAAHDGSDIGAFPLKARPGLVKPIKIIPPELYLEAVLEDSGGDGFLSGGEQAHLKAVISNIGQGPAFDVRVSYSSNNTAVGEGSKKISELPPQAKKEIKFPLAIPEDVADGDATITLEAVDKSGFNTEPVVLNVPVLTIMGRLGIETDPQKASVYIDGILRGETPLAQQELLPKDYQIRITLKDHEEINETITLGPREEKVRQFVLLKLKGNLLVETDPPGARITFQDYIEGVSPLEISYKDVGTYTIAAEKYTPEVIMRYKGEVEIVEKENKIKIDRFTTLKVPPGMVLIPDGEFEMGSNEDSPDENPAHKIYLENYYIDKHEVSWGDFMKFVREQKRPKPFYAEDLRFSGDDYPAVGITFDEAQKYAEWVGKRLPTEAEWEKAAKSNNNWAYPWGNEFSPGKANLATSPRQNKLTAPVAGFPGGASPYGVLNMAGNVWEWCSDFYNATYYYVSPPRNPKGPRNEKRYVLRGGAWNESRYNARTTRRWSYWPDLQRNYIGLRLVFPPNQR